jgi:hypothetical protein
VKSWPLLLALLPAVAWCAPLRITATDAGMITTFEVRE